jgi:hypothetical protein
MANSEFERPHPRPLPDFVKATHNHTSGARA